MFTRPNNDNITTIQNMFVILQIIKVTYVCTKLLCCVFVLFFFVWIPYVVNFSGLSIFDWGQKWTIQRNWIFSNVYLYINDSNMTSFFRFVNKRASYPFGIISLAHAPVNVTDFSTGSINCNPNNADRGRSIIRVT